MKKVIIASIAALALILGSAASANAAFSTYLRVGSTGADVSALQTWLIANHFNIPSIQSGAAQTGYFGQQTKAAVVAYQASVGLPSTGFVGPLTIAKLNSAAPVAMTPAPSTQCPVGYTCTANPGTVVTNPATNGTSLTTISTPGVPGILSVTSGPLSSSVMNVGQTMAPVLAVRVQAQYSDLDVQTINVDLGNNTSFFNKLFNKIYVTDGTNVLASQVLNSSTVVQSGSNYIVGLAGFHFIVKAGSYRDLVIKADLNSSIDSAYLSGGANYPSSGTNLTSISAGWGIGVDANGLRAVDGAGINLNGPAAAQTQALTINKSLVDNAQANISVDGSSPQANQVSVTDTTNGNYLGLPVLTFDVYAQNDTQHLHNIAINFAQSGTGSITAAYLYQGSTRIQSASVSSNVATFSNITDGTAGATIPIGTTLPFTVKVDITGVTSGNLSVTASTSANANQTIYNSIDGNVTVAGSAQGNTIIVNGVGPSFSLTSGPTIMTSGTNTSGTTAYSTSTIIASFPLSISAVGADVYFGTLGSTTPAFYFTVLNSSNSIIYSGYGTSTDAANSAGLSNTQTVLPTLPAQVTNGVTQLNSFKVANQNTVNLGTVQFQFAGKDIHSNTLTGGPYKVNLAGIRYVSSAGVATSTFMSGLQAWTTAGQNP